MPKAAAYMLQTAMDGGFAAIRDPQSRTGNKYEDK
jgi:hypothetical protein